MCWLLGALNTEQQQFNLVKDVRGETGDSELFGMCLGLGGAPKTTPQSKYLTANSC